MSEQHHDPTIRGAAFVAAGPLGGRDTRGAQPRRALRRPRHRRQPPARPGRGSVHGLFYLTGIALVWTNRLPTFSKVLVLIPAIGTLLAARHQTRILAGTAL